MYLPLLDIAATHAGSSPDPIIAAGGVMGILATLIQLIKRVFRLADARVLLLALVASIVTASLLTLATYWGLVDVIVTTIMSGMAIFIQSSGLYHHLRSSSEDDADPKE